MAYSLTIGGTSIPVGATGAGTKMALTGWRITRAANGRREFTFEVLSADGSYRPTYDAEVIFTDGSATVVFGGSIIQTEERGAGGLATPIITKISAQDFNILAARRYVSETIPAGTLKAALEVLVEYLPGATLAAAQVTGPDLPDLVYADVKTEDVLNDIGVQCGGWLWQIDSDKVLSVYEPGTVAGPENITEASGRVPLVYGDLVITPTRRVGAYANRVIVRNSTLRSLAEDAAAIASFGVWEIVFTAPDTTTEDGMDSLATMLLARALVVPKTAKFRTFTSGFDVGQSLTINVPSRNINNSYLITDVNSAQVAPLEEATLHDVTAVEGLAYRPGWRETYKQWGGGGITIGGAGATVVQSRFAYFLGGNGLDFTQSPTPTWVPASGGGVIGQGAVQVQIDTIPRGTLLATVTVRLRSLDSGVTVKARLYDVTDSVACAGESAEVNNTEWETVTFGLTLTPGSHYYELQLLPGVANADVAGVGYLL